MTNLPITDVLRITALALSVTSCADLQRARLEANEASAIGSLRAIVSGEMAYASSNGFAYGSLECLAAPKTCNPSDSGVAHVDAALAAAGERSGYRLEFHPGPDADAAAGRPRGAALRSFAMVATPVTPGVTGTRRFCIDDRAELCTLEASATPTDGRCPASCVAVP